MLPELDTNPAVSFVIITYRRPGYLQRALDSIVKQNYRPLEIVVLDNGNELTTDIFANLSDSEITTRLIVSESNLGVSRGRNLGMEQSSGEILICMDDDAVCLTVDFVEQVIDALKGDRSRAAIACRSVDEQGQILRYELPRTVRDKDVGSEVPEVPYFVGVSLSLRKSALQTVGGFPDSHFYGAEEYDLSLRLVDAGYRIVYVHGAVVQHDRALLGRESSSENHLRWMNVASNKARTTIRLLPFPYCATAPLIWFVYMVWKTRFDPSSIAQFAIRIRASIRQAGIERRPISRKTVVYLRSIGERLWY